MTKEDYLEHVKNNVLRNREPDVYDIEDAYMEGYSQACYEAARNIDKLVEQFKKSWEQ